MPATFLPLSFISAIFVAVVAYGTGGFWWAALAYVVTGSVTLLGLGLARAVLAEGGSVADEREDAGAVTDRKKAEA